MFASRANPQKARQALLTVDSFAAHMRNVICPDILPDLAQLDQLFRFRVKNAGE